MEINNSEKDWIVLVAKKNDEVAFRKLFDLYYASLVNYAFYIVRSYSLAEEIVSEVFVNLWNSRAKLIEIQDFKRYVYTSTKHKSIDYIRKAKNLIFIGADSTSLRECITYENPEDKCIEEEIRQKLEETVLKLPEKCRLIYRMVKEEHMKYHDVAELMDISAKTVENQMIIAMKRIREEIYAYYNSSEDNQKIKFFNVLLMF